MHIDALAPELAEILTLRYFDDLSRKETAEVMEITESLVKSRLDGARKQLRARMKDDSV